MSSIEIDRSEALDALRVTAGLATREDMHKVLAKQARIYEKLEKIEEEKPVLFRRIKRLFELVYDFEQNVNPNLTWDTVAVAVTALNYFFADDDLIPDKTPEIGFNDDAAIFGLAVELIEDELRAYLEARGFDPDVVI